MGDSRSPSPAGSPPLASKGDASPVRDASPEPRDRSPVPDGPRDSPDAREDLDMNKSPRRARSHTRSLDRRPREPSRSVTPVRRSSRSPERRRVRERSRSRERAPRERSPDRGRYRSPEKDRRRDYDRRDARGRSRSRERTRNSERYRGNGRGRPGNTVFVAGFNFITTERDLDRKFSKYGRVIDVRIVKDRRNGESKGFGFVTMETDEDADEAVYKLDQTTWNGRVVLVEKAKSDKRVD